MEKKFWYAVVTNNDADWGYGSYDEQEAREMAVNLAKSGKYNTVELVTVEDGNDPVAVDSEVIEA